MSHDVEIRKTKSVTLGKSQWEVDSVLCQVLVDGVFVGYCTKQKGTLNIVVDAPGEIIDAAKSEVKNFWGEPVDSVSLLTPLDGDDDEEDELDD